MARRKTPPVTTRPTTEKQCQIKIAVPADTAEVLLSDQRPGESRVEYIIRLYETATGKPNTVPRPRPAGNPKLVNSGKVTK